MCMIVVRLSAAFQDIFLECRQAFQSSPVALKRVRIPPPLSSIIISPTTSDSATLVSPVDSIFPIFSVTVPQLMGCDACR